MSDRPEANEPASARSLEDECYLAGTGIAVFGAALVAAAAAALAAGGGVSPWQLAVALAAALVVVWLGARRRNPRRAVPAFARVSAALLAVLAVSTALAAAVYDTSYDGQTYHMDGVVRLAGGWNPASIELTPARAGESGAALTAHFEKLNGYAKGPWYVAAALYGLTGRVETGKALNFILLAASACFAFALLSPITGRRPAALLAALAAANPVVLNQLFTFYVDGQLASALTSLACVLLVPRERYGWLQGVAVAALVVFAVNVKFTGVPFVLAVGVGLALFRLAVDGDRGTVAVVVLAAAAGIAGIGFEPYVTNTVREGHPFHPVSEDSRLRNAIAADFLAKNRFEKAFLSLFSESKESALERPSPKAPFTVSRDELASFAAPDTRLGGFGPLFGGCLIVAAAVWVLIFREDRRRAWAAAGLALLAIATALTIPEPWWARFVPQLWAVPVVVAAAGVAARGAARRGAWLLVAALAANLALAAGPRAVAVFVRDRAVARQLRELRDAGPVEVRIDELFGSSRVRLAEARVSFVEVETLPCSDPVELERSFSRVEVCAGP